MNKLEKALLHKKFKKGCKKFNTLANKTHGNI